MRLNRPCPLMAPLVAARVVKGLSQADVADMLEVSAAHVSQVETGTCSPRVSELSHYARIVDLRFDPLFTSDVPREED